MIPKHYVTGNSQHKTAKNIFWKTYAASQKYRLNIQILGSIRYNHLKFIFRNVNVYSGYSYTAKLFAVV